MVNFLTLLGWSPGAGDQEVFSRDDLVAAFDLRGISGGDAVFNPDKLDWFNQQHLLRLAPAELARRLRPSFEDAGVWDEAYLGNRHAWFFAVLELLKPRAKRLNDFLELGRFFFIDVVEYDPVAVATHLGEGVAVHLLTLSSTFAALPSFDASTTEAALRGVAAERSVKAATLIHATRVALTGKMVSPGLFEVIALLGRDRTRARLVSAATFVPSARL
jgi:glutamyl-tRNA synthetase